MLRKLWKKTANLRRKHKFRKFYGAFIKEGDLCFDIGANLGNRTEIFSDLKAQVISIEPVEESYAILQNKFGKNKNITILPLAVGSQSGTETIYISNYLEVCTLSEKFIEKYGQQKGYDIQWNESRLIEITTLDHLLAEYGIPKFCKIDVEGYELEVFKGLSQTLPLISFEYNARLKHLALECIDLLSQFNSLQFNFSPYESMIFHFKSWKSKNDFYSFIATLPEEVKTGDIYVKNY